MGRVGRAVGLKGEVEVTVLSDAPDRFSPGSALELDDRTLTIRSLRTQGQRTIVTFEDVADRTGAERLKGAELFIQPDQARPLEEGEFWDHDLIGCDVVTTGGDRVGEVTDVLHHGANEVLVLKSDMKEHLVPLVGHIVKHIEPRVRITIDPIEGLLD